MRSEHCFYGIFSGFLMIETRLLIPIYRNELQTNSHLMATISQCLISSSFRFEKPFALKSSCGAQHEFEIYYVFVGCGTSMHRRSIDVYDAIFFLENFSSLFLPPPPVLAVSQFSVLLWLRLHFEATARWQILLGENDVRVCPCVCECDVTRKNGSF